MKVLSLLQPWATATVTQSNIGPFAIKSWETRSWKPNPENLKRIQTASALRSGGFGTPQLQYSTIG